MGGTEQDFVNLAFDTNWVAPLGPNVNGFEDDLKKYNSIDGCTVLSSGTAALHLALILIGVEQDDEVLCSTFTFSATANAIAYQKAKPVFNINGLAAGHEKHAGAEKIKNPVGNGQSVLAGQKPGTVLSERGAARDEHRAHLGRVVVEAVRAAVPRGGAERSHAPRVLFGPIALVRVRRVRVVTGRVTERAFVTVA